MASKYFGLNHGLATYNNPQAITVGTSTGSTDIELRIDLTKSITTEEAALACDVIKNRILTGALGNADLTSI